VSAKKRRKRRPRRPPATPSQEQPARSHPPTAARSRRAAADDERPPAPWGSFPLVELVVLVGLVMLVAGFAVGGTRGSTMIVVGLVLGALGGLELSIREHFAGYRSHTVLLSGAVAIAVLAALAFLVPSLRLPFALAIAAAAFAVSAYALGRVFRRRSGLAFKVR
jgi:hypothetical protein